MNRELLEEKEKEEKKEEEKEEEEEEEKEEEERRIKCTDFEDDSLLSKSFRSSFTS